MFYKYLWKKKWLILLFVVLYLISSSSMSYVNLQVKPLFDGAQTGKFSEVIFGLLFIFLGFLFARLIEHYSNLAGIHLVNVVRRDIKRDLFSNVINKKLPDYADKNVGEYIAEFTNDITIVEEKFLIPFKEVISYFIILLTTSVAILTIDYRMVLIVLGGVALCVGLPFLMVKHASNRMIKFLARFDQFVQRLKDTFTAFFTFKNYAVEGKVVEKLNKENDEVEEVKFKAEMSIVVIHNVVGRLAWLVEILVIVTGMLGVVYGDLSVGHVFSAALLAGNLGRPLQDFSGRISKMQSVKGIAKKFKIIGALDERVKEDESIVKYAPDFDIKIENVSLSLKDSLILDNVSMTFERGKKYLIIGGNGSGKSTTAKLLKNNYRSYSGTVKLGEHDLQSPEGVGLTRHISYSNETVSLISDTVRNNVTLYRDVDEDRLERATKLAELGVSLDRMVGDNGRFLSSGERRKLEIARALIEEPKVLIFDEVVSTLDIETAYEIEKLVLSLKDLTVIMISNAFSGQLLGEYDEIIMMDKGRVIASGKHKDMLEKSPEYRKVYQLRCGEAEGGETSAN